MAIGISTSCLYPETPEISLDALGKAGVKTCEVFLNSISETSLSFAKELNKIKENYGMNIVSVHPFSSFAETNMFFSEYKRRFDDAVEFYKRNFEVAAELGAELIVIHGSRLLGKIEKEEYFERFFKLYETGKAFGVETAQENVNLFFSENPIFLREMKKSLGDNFKMVFDVKQAVRAGYEPLAFAKEFAESIIHVHLSDHKSGADCLPPSQGNFNFKALFNIMNEAGYNKNYVVELYRKNFDCIDTLIHSLAYLSKI